MNDFNSSETGSSILVEDNISKLFEKKNNILKREN